jgi:hypothetical protein
MPDMVLVQCENGSRAAKVLCPDCGRISLQILDEPFSPNRVAKLKRTHTCPICGTVYQACSQSQAGNWSAAFSRYDRSPDAYNQSVKENYAKRKASQAPTATQNQPLSQPIRTTPQPAEHYWYCGVSFSGFNTTYSYISDSGRLEAGTRVLVPFGSNNTQRIGMVKTCQLVTAATAPFPPSNTKHIIRIATETELRSSESVPPLFSYGREDVIPLVSTLQQVAEKKAEEVKVESAPVRSNPAVNEEKPAVSALVTEAPTRPAEAPGISLDTIQMPSKAQEPGVTPDEDLDRKIDRWKRELLDTGKRNKMINYRETKRATLRILEPDASTLFNKLVSSEKPLTFQKPINKDTDLRTYSMIALMETLSYNLNVQVGDIKTAGTIIEREKTLKNLRSKAKLAQEEQGTNILYLCFGFIYWREQNRESSPWFKAPLLMMPVTLGLKSLNAPFTLSRYDDEIEVNPTLDYLFNTEYHIDLPTFEYKNKSSFDEYMAQIEEIVDKRGWKVMPEVSLGLLSFLKISMYHDLNNNRELIVNHPVLRAMAGDRTAIGELPPQAENFDFDGVKPTEWHEVVDSDSSQEEAILLSKLGVSFVMQGPPGTGKSQTITNIIAEALADGKKVLFVSEKAAALQVVLKRLTEVHLDDFCLSLHNYKANKKEIIDSIGANLSLEEEYIDNSAYSELTELFHDREFLNAYASELHTAIAPLDQSVYMVFGKISKLEKATVLEFSLDKPTEITKEQYSSILYCVSAFEKALHNMGGALTANPWHGTKATSSGQMYKAQLLRDTAGLSEGLRSISVLAPAIDQRFGMGSTRSFAEVKKLLEVARILKAKPDYISKGWFDSDISSRARALLEEAKQHAETLHQRMETVRQDWKESAINLDVDGIRDSFCGDFSWVYDSTGNASVEERLSEEKDHAAELLKEITGVLTIYQEASDLLSYRQDDSMDSIRMISRVLGLVSEAPYMESSWFDARKNAELVPLIEEAVKHSALLSSMTQEILKDWEPTAFDIDVDAMLSRFKTEYVGMFHRMKAGYKEDIKTLRLHSKAVGAKIEEENAIAFLQKLKEYRAEKAWFSENEAALATAIGSQYKGEETDWTRVRSSMDSALRIAAEFPYNTVSEETIAAMLRITESLQLSGTVRRFADALAADTLAGLEQKIRESRYIEGYQVNQSVGRSIVPQITEFIDRCEAQIHSVADFKAEKLTDGLCYEDITTLISNITAINAERRWFSDHEAIMHTLFEQADRGDSSNWSLIAEGLDTAEELRVAFADHIPESIQELACSDAKTEIDLWHQVDQLNNLVEETSEPLRKFDSQFTTADFEMQDFATVADRYEACIHDFGELNKWLDYVETRQECDKLGLADFTAKIAAADNTISDVQACFERGFYLQWLQMQLDNVPAVQSFRRRIQEQRSERFVKLDEKQYEIARKRIRERIISTYPRLNRVARAGSELGILRHEMEKKRRIMPLRKLFRSIPTLLLTLKPCLMMSPLSVAYFLEAGSYQFDMVIFDEASQIFPQDAIGAIFRAKQVVIAGDTKQLPPTNFFAASTSNSSEGYDDDEGYDEEVYDSILEETANILPNRTLLWHYRSKHEHLIAFSNQEIYRNDLVTFPSSNESERDTGVEFVYVEEGYYEPSPKNYNIAEAQQIVLLVKDHIDKHPDRSLGIIAFSEKQQQAILLEVQRFREKNPEYEGFFVEGKEDEFFVKNLENVQGDERDTIFFSVGYAKTKEQKANGKPMSMRFGPLGVAGGERRLNVAITRAKINVKLVSSILPSDIDLSRTESDGIRMLRSYIEFAMNGEASLASAHRSGRPDDFADSIAQYIREHGYKVKQYVGCSGYKIDIAVQHPSDTVDQFVAGIECDGFSYVAARTARDRDRLRSTVLKNMGWNLYRVWSAEWYKNPEIEGQKLLTFIKAAIVASEAKIKQIEEEQRKAEEAKRAEIKKARAAREAEERKRQQELEQKEAKLKAEREAAARKKAEEAERKAAKLRADQEAARKREEERRAAEEQRRKEAEERKNRTDLSWVKVGVRVNHKRFGNGIITSISKDQIKVRFGKDERTLMYPSSFENGLLTKQVVQEKPIAKGPDWAAVGAKVHHNSFGDGVITAIDGGHLTVRFGDVSKPFVYPDAFTRGFLKQPNLQSEKKQVPLTTSKNGQASLLETLKAEGFRYIDNRSTSSILWVLYEPMRKADFERIIADYNVQCKLEKRGALATKNAPAWRIMFN